MHSFESLEIVPGYMGRIRCGPEWSLDARWSRNLHDYDLWYVWAGRGRMITSDGAIDLFAGRGLWMRPGRRYEAEQNPRERLGVTFVHFRLKTKKRLLDPAEFTPPVEVFDVRHPDYFNAALAHVTRLRHGHALAPESPLLLKALLLEAVSDGTHNADASASEAQHSDVAARALAFLQENPTTPVNRMARRIGYSADHFARVFRQVTGETPKDCAIRIRMERAMTLLRESSQTIGQIADAMGYEDVGFFSRQFKQKIGVSPAGFRRRRQEA